MGSVRWSTRALEALDALDPPTKGRILYKINWIKEYIAHIAHQPLHRELIGLYKARVGDYRIVYSIKGNIMTIEGVGHRRDIYR